MLTKERMEFVEPMLTKCEEPLDKVTMQAYGGGGATSSGSGGDSCNFWENLTFSNGCHWF